MLSILHDVEHEEGRRSPVFLRPASTGLFELMRNQMTEKPVLRAEVCARCAEVRCVNRKSRKCMESKKLKKHT